MTIQDNSMASVRLDVDKALMDDFEQLCQAISEQKQRRITKTEMFVRLMKYAIRTHKLPKE